MALFKATNKLDRVFEISIFFKAFDGLLETIGGMLLLVVKPSTITGIAHTLTQHELSHDPHDFIAVHLLHSAEKLAAGGSLFAAIYLLSHGLTKVILVIEILREKLWAYRGMVFFLGLFILYQLYLMIHHFTISMLILTVFDAFIICLTLREEKRQHLIKARTKTSKE
jgi:uncharacterized membrane protein